MKLKQLLPAASVAIGAISIVALQGCAVVDVPAADPQANQQPGAPVAAGCAADRLTDETLVGKSEKEASDLLQGCAWRIGERDGEHYAGAMDYREERLTISLAGGKVIWVRRG
ncbi:hypothetical protein [Collimonas sp.]|jgi:hypothetical protein|uniref:hypothetical protein n=1 Tax=Collimonas sp. TaxID=1963772 RepID=UPI0037C065F8